MGRGQKRKADGDLPEVSADPEIVAKLQALPRQTLLTFRRDLALQPFQSAAQSLNDVSSGLADLLESIHSEEGVARSLREALGGSTWCWSFSSTSEEVHAARKALGTMLMDGREKLLASLRQGDAFCAAVKKHSSRRDGQPLLQLGKTRAMWLLGAGAEEGDDQATKKAPRAKKRKIKVAKAGQAEESESSLSDSEPAGKKGKASTSNATQEFLAQLRAKRSKMA